MRTKYKVPDITTEEKREYLKSRGWETSWSDDNWVRSEAKNKEANTGIDTHSAYYYQYGIDNNLRYVVHYN
jgi:hypothetical protein